MLYFLDELFTLFDTSKDIVIIENPMVFEGVYNLFNTIMLNLEFDEPAFENLIKKIL